MARKELIKLINMLLPPNSKLPKTYSKILSFLNVKDSLIEEMRYCNQCGDKIDTKICKNSECQKFNVDSIKYDSFIYVDIKDQIKDILCSYFEIIEKYIKENKQSIDINHNVTI